jgi:hypothetical protein
VRPVLLVILVAVPVIAGLTLWIPSSDGTKQESLGSALISGVVVGLALYVVARVFASGAEERQSEELGAAALRSTFDGGTPQDNELVHAARAPEPGYSVEYEGSIRDTTRIDAQQVRLRVFRGSEYFQFVTVPVPGPSFRRQVGLESGLEVNQVWWAVGHAAGPFIESAIARGDIPLDTPSNAYEVLLPDAVLNQAIAEARRGPDVVATPTVYRFKEPGGSSAG